MSLACLIGSAAGGPCHDAVQNSHFFHVGVSWSNSSSVLGLEFLADLVPEPVEIFLPAEGSEVVAMDYASDFSLCIPEAS